MNRKLIKQIRDQIQVLIDTGHTENFNMGVYLGDPVVDEDGIYYSDVISATSDELVVFAKQYESCETAACIAGWACILKAGEFKTGWRFDYEADGAALLDLTYDQAEHMFQGHWSPTHIDNITAQEAVEYLDRVLEQGTVFA